MSTHHASAPVQAIVIHGEKDLRVESVNVEPPGKGEVQVAIRHGGICGSDLHYYNHGGFGAIRIREPMTLGHEVSGEIIDMGEGVDGLVIGDHVAVSPSRPCGECRFCQEGLQQHCLNMRFYGSAMPMPHIQGAFAQRITAKTWQCHKIAKGISLKEAAFAEPFAVALHAVARGGPLFGKSVLVTGCGPIGALTALAANLAGAKSVLVTDVSDTALNRAAALTRCTPVNVATSGGDLEGYAADKGQIDVMFEASGNEAAVRTGLDLLRPQGTLVQLGLGGDVSLPQNIIVAKEIELRGSFRFHGEFAQAVDLINRKEVDLGSLLTHSYGFEKAREAFETASDRQKSMKVQIDF